MARFHGALLDSGRALLLAAAFGSLPGSVTAEALFSSDAREAVLESLWDNVDIAMTEQSMMAQNRWHATGQQPADDSSVVYLLAIYQDGASNSGSGTIIRGDDGQNRVLTAGHVVPLAMPAEDGSANQLMEIIAFSTEGKALASLDYLVTGYDGMAPGTDESAGIAEIINDVAVLEAISFDTRSDQEYWSGLGVRIAENIPDGILVASAGPSSAILNRGISGASIRDDRGDVIGIISYSYSLNEAPRLEGGSRYMSAVTAALTQSDPYLVSDIVVELASGLDGDREDRRSGSIGVGSPVLQAEVLEALRAGPVNPVPAGSEITARIAGFPDYELRAESVQAFGLAAYEIPHALGSDGLKIQEFPLDGSYLIWEETSFEEHDYCVGVPLATDEDFMPPRIVTLPNFFAGLDPEEPDPSRF